MLHCRSRLLSSVSQQSPVNGTPSRFCKMAPMERVTHFQNLLLRVSQIPQYTFSWWKNLTLDLKSLGKEQPLHVPQNRAPMGGKTPIYRALLNISLRVPSEAPSHRAPREREREREREICSISRALLSLKVPGKSAPPPAGSSMGSPRREMPVSRAFLYLSFRVASKVAPSSWFP